MTVRRRWGRVGALCAGIVATTVLAAACGSSARPAAVAVDLSSPQAAAQTFLRRYVQLDGRVVRIDQGGDTVSEGQAYALLLDVATGNRTQFAAVWSWSHANLMQSDGLLAFHWQNGKVVDRNSASDADVDVARALVLAGRQWHDPTWTAQGKTYASAILAHETVSAGGHLWLVAGPWATTGPYYVDPSYLDPGSFDLLASISHDPRWTELATSSQITLSAVTHDGAQLPSDWATVQTSGQVQPATPPTGGATVYGYDAFRTLIRQADTCTPGPARRLDAKLLPLAAKTAAPSDRADDYNLDGTASEAGNNPLMLIAAAGAAGAAGDSAARNRYLDQAAAAEATQQTYYLDAWVALGRYLLTTTVLSGCNA